MSATPLRVDRNLRKRRCDRLDPPDFLGGKVVRGGGLDPEEIERRANEAIAAMHDDYLRQAYQDMARIDCALARVRSVDGTALAEALQDVLWIAHEMRGQAGTFGYELVTTIGTEICRTIDEAETPEAVVHEVLAIHVDTMRAVISGRLTGDGGPTGETLLAGMNAMVAKAARAAAE